MHTSTYVLHWDGLLNGWKRPYVRVNIKAAVCNRQSKKTMYQRILLMPILAVREKCNRNDGEIYFTGQIAPHFHFALFHLVNGLELKIGEHEAINWCGIFCMYVPASTVLFDGHSNDSGSGGASMRRLHGAFSWLHQTLSMYSNERQRERRREVASVEWEPIELVVATHAHTHKSQYNSFQNC